ncbi:hypothetical protein CC85DRAFT_328574 [Cutaneotrichosporon oleaginosum]|uniref:Uncharacterized protein n=1 Tax=Cutaneotrichosporon oleaginosum TaxID=879819 RepID=A0A0J0XLR9_9TREE|nr:uncharacterized protein CC85DRAFT_328574 [Cutaneotrichosporon oleaginosum]KLT42013.1 hypothetical protein CC85DRAFT_328574 [Cutaneotrichosporon oleaginosum]TXT14330.1 hypothetical protein COLE_00523 [Cutaneotrichosporon oleaginosum]
MTLPSHTSSNSTKSVCIAIPRHPYSALSHCRRIMSERTQAQANSLPRPTSPRQQGHSSPRPSPPPAPPHRQTSPYRQASPQSPPTHSRTPSDARGHSRTPSHTPHTPSHSHTPPPSYNLPRQRSSSRSQPAPLDPSQDVLTAGDGLASSLGVSPTSYATAQVRRSYELSDLSGATAESAQGPADGLTGFDPAAGYQEGSGGAYTASGGMQVVPMNAPALMYSGGPK